jgi:hypothetical protein
MSEQEQPLNFERPKSAEAEISADAADAFADRVKTHFQADGLIAKAVGELEVLVRHAKDAGAPASSDRQTQTNETRTGDINFNIGPATMALLVALIIIVAACALIMGLNLAKQDQMDRDFRAMQTAEALKERRLIDIESYAMLNGWKIPSDDTHGPTGNLQRMIPREKAK